MFDLSGRDPKLFSEFRRIMPPKDRFWADPFIIRKEHKYYIFFEELIYNKQKGHISLIVMDEEGTYESPIKVLERPYHISYPFVFEWKRDYYMIPETHFNGTIELYKSRSFPHGWVFHSTLMQGVVASDSTLFWYKNRWWLFTYMALESVENKKNISTNCSHCLSLFYSDDLFSQIWVAHPANPIVMDKLTARPAGRIFEKDGKIVRPSQDCSIRYGHGIRLNEIVILSETKYEENEIQTIGPQPGSKLLGVHTYNRDCSLTVMDGARLIFSPRLFRITKILRNILR